MSHSRDRDGTRIDARGDHLLRAIQVAGVVQVVDPRGSARVMIAEPGELLHSCDMTRAGVRHPVDSLFP
jgi:hypothetical protein